ncbi:MAG TPA: hypothetical protein VKT80_06170, partial [Chloroflexota bacterium]|nr:hypothetical protein [Chloroflexota bacterium]
MASSTYSSRQRVLEEFNVTHRFVDRVSGGAADRLCLPAAPTCAIAEQDSSRDFVLSVCRFVFRIPAGVFDPTIDELNCLFRPAQARSKRSRFMTLF